MIVPVYNAEKFLAKCISSVVSELEAQDELILVNDGSKDSSEQICRRYQAANVQVYSIENHGVSFARNYGIEQAKGEYYMFLDADDYLKPGWREMCAKGTQLQKDIVYFTNTVVSEEKKELVRSILQLPTSRNYGIFPGACWGKLFRASLVEEQKIRFPLGVINGEDGLFHLYAVKAAESWGSIQTHSFYFYRENLASATHVFNEKYVDSNRKYIQLLREILTGWSLFSENEVDNYIDFVTACSLYILACRISVIQDPQARKDKYQLFCLPEFTCMSDEVSLKNRIATQTVRLIQKRNYNAAIALVSVEKQLRYMLGKVRGFFDGQ